MMKKEYTQPCIFMIEERLELLWGSEFIPGGTSDDTEVTVGSGTVDPEDALARSGYSVWDE